MKVAETFDRMWLPMTNAAISVLLIGLFGNCLNLGRLLEKFRPKRTDP